MRALLALLLCLSPLVAAGQSREVGPSDLRLEVAVENADSTPYAGEMVLVTIRGTYRRHITRETLQQPDLNGFNWMQLGSDDWFESREDGLTVKSFRRRMALFPTRPGTLTIAPFVHHLTLTDEGDDWFEHDIRSEPVTVTVLPSPVSDDRWFPVRRLEISDTWSNPPDQLGDGAGVLRVIMLKAVGAAPSMMPPMPDLVSPSAMIFPHPEKRLVELSPEGPVTYAFWRWTIRPSNDTSAILEPISLDYFDTVARVARTATISAQRIAIDEALLPAPVPPSEPGRLNPLAAGLAGTAGFLFGIGALVPGLGRRRWRWPGWLDPARRGLIRAARRGDLAALRRAAHRLDAAAPPSATRRRLLAELDRAIYAPAADDADRLPANFASRFLGALPPVDRGPPIPTNG